MVPTFTQRRRLLMSVSIGLDHLKGSCEFVKLVSMSKTRQNLSTDEMPQNAIQFVRFSIYGELNYNGPIFDSFTKTSKQWSSESRIASQKNLERTVGKKTVPSWSDKQDDHYGLLELPYTILLLDGPYKLVYGRAVSLTVYELEHKAYWALKHANFDLKTAGDYRKLQLNELSELRDQAYENSLIYKEKTKKATNTIPKIKEPIFMCDQVHRFQLPIKRFSPKAKSHGRPF
ncbi:hypothetical protein Tco_1219012 [Tanacetum coccineum]